MRLLTRSDFDGLACGTLLKELGLVDSWKFVHPKDIQDGKIEVDSNDVLANVPFVEGCGLWFDHHSSETERLGTFSYNGMSRQADSAARVIFDFYADNGKLTRFSNMIKAVDKVDAAKLSCEEILNPTGWVLLGFIMDPRTGLGRFRDFKISNYELMEMLMDCCRTMDIDQILQLPDVLERTKLYFEQAQLFKQMLLEHTTADANVIITDLRGIENIFAGNRFIVYSLFPNQNISIWIIDGKLKQNCPIAVGHSVINRTSKTDVGSLLLKYGGGGHFQVGTCQVPYSDADSVVAQLVEAIKNDG